MNVAQPTSPPPTPTDVRHDVPIRRVPGGVAGATKDGNEALLAQRPDDALALYSKAQVGAPEMPEIEYNRGLAALLAGDAAEAAKAFETTRDLAVPKPNSEPVSDALLDDSRFNAAHAEWAQDHLAEAIQGWASVVAKDPAAAAESMQATIAGIFPS